MSLSVSLFSVPQAFLKFHYDNESFSIRKKLHFLSKVTATESKRRDSVKLTLLNLFILFLQDFNHNWR